MNTRGFFSFNQHLVDKHDSIVGKKLTLVRTFLIIAGGTTTFFFLIEFFYRTGMPWSIYAFIFTACVINFFLVSKGRSKEASIYLFFFLNVILYLVTSSEKMRTGFHLHTITVGFGALLLFGYEEKKWGLFFAILSGIVYIASFTFDYSPLSFRDYSSHWVTAFFWINGTLFIVTVLYLFTMMMNLNYNAEKWMAESNQQSLLQNQQLSKTNEELDQFVFSTSNDLRAPLNSISGLINLAQADALAGQEYLRMMKEQIVVMEGFIKEIIDFSRNSRQEVESSIIIVRDLVEEIISSLNHASGFDSVKREIEIAEDLIVPSDASRLKSVLTNLIANAIQYADFNKEISFVKISGRKEGDNVLISIEDNGIGIDPEQQPKIFDMFYRGTDRSKGSGLGLYIVKETLTKLKGGIDFKSQVNKGTEFTVKLPLKHSFNNLKTVG
jgi:signal transduction histidine kinase